MKRIALVMLLLGGCVTDKPVHTADGRVGHMIQCPDAGNIKISWGQCYERAGELCGARGYDVLEKSDEKNAFASYNAYGGGAGTATNRMMMIRCKG